MMKVRRKRGGGEGRVGEGRGAEGRGGGGGRRGRGRMLLWRKELLSQGRALGEE